MMSELAGGFVFLKAVSILLSLGLCLATDGRADGSVAALLVGLCKGFETLLLLSLAILEVVAGSRCEEKPR